MRSNDRQVVIRRADKNDLEGIFSALTKCANEIPVRMDGTEREAHFIKLIRQGCFSGRSYVAVSDNAVVGFVLATHSLPPGWYELDYGAILPEFRGYRFTLEPETGAGLGKE
jgi:hypothetical protein